MFATADTCGCGRAAERCSVSDNNAISPPNGCTFREPLATKATRLGCHQGWLLQVYQYSMATFQMGDALSSNFLPAIYIDYLSHVRTLPLYVEGSRTMVEP